MHPAFKQALVNFVRFEAKTKRIPRAVAFGLIERGEPLADVRGIKQDQAGRKVKTIHKLSNRWFGLDVHADQMRKILSRHNAPKSWERHLSFIVRCVLNPSLLNLKGTNPEKKAVMSSVRFSQLYAESPRSFLAVTSAITAYFDKVVKSPECLVAQLMSASPDASRVKAEYLHDVFGFRVTRKVVDHARERARSAKPF